MGRLTAAFLALLAFSGVARAQSTIDPSLPANGLPYTSAPIRNNFQESYNNINDLYAKVGALGLSVATLTAQKAQSVSGLTSTARLMRDGYAAAGDGGAAVYTYSTSACTLNAGAGDNGWQVKPDVGTGCWIMDPTVIPPNILQWGGAADNGTTDNGAVLTAAWTASNGTYCIQVPPSAGIYEATTAATAPTGKTSCIDGIGGTTTHMMVKTGAGLPLIDLTGSGTGLLVSNIELDGNKTGNPSAGKDVVYLGPGTSGITFENAWVHDGSNDSVRCDGCQNFSAPNGGYYDSAGDGIEFTAVSGTRPEHFFACGFFWGNGFSGAAIGGYAANGQICGTAWSNGFTPPLADNFTGYNANNQNVVWGPLVSTDSGNNCVHVGGSNITLNGITCDTPQAHGIVFYSKEAYAAGTAAFSSASPTVTGSGTTWSGLFPYNGFNTNGFGASITDANGVSHLVKSIDSNTQITLQANAGSTVSGTYSLSGITTSTGASIAGPITVTGVAAGLNCIEAFELRGLVVSGAVSVTGGCDRGVYLRDVQGGVVSGVVASASAVAGIGLDGIATDTSGTADFTNSSAVVTGHGTSFLTFCTPGGGTRIAPQNGSAAAGIVLSCDSDTQVTLTAPWGGSTALGSSYAITIGSSTVAITGTSLASNPIGVNLKGSINSTIVGNQFSNNTSGVSDNASGSISSGNLIQGNNIVGSTTPITAKIGLERVGANAIDGAIQAFGVPTVASSLPTCNAASKYQIFNVSDANAPTWGSTVSGGGTVPVIVMCDSTNWKVQ